MNNRALRHALNGLAHPVSLGAMLVLLVNDALLRRICASWLTGKISDFAWLVFAPLALAVFLACLIPPRLRRQEAITVCLALALTVGVFSLPKTLPAAHTVAMHLLAELFGGPVDLRRDPTDLSALPGILAAWIIWRARVRPIPMRKGFPALALAMLACAATSPPVLDLGVVDLAEQDSEVTTLTRSGVFFSKDGGLSWERRGEPGGWYGPVAEPARDAWRLADPVDDRVQYRFTRGKAIERSADGGQTWQTEIDPSPGEARIVYLQRTAGQATNRYGLFQYQPGPADAVLERSTGSLIVAMGLQGVVVRTPDGRWHWTAVGPYARVDMSTPEAVLSLISHELWLAAALFFLAVGTLAWRLRPGKWGTFWLCFLWCVWVLGVLASVVATGDSTGMGDALVMLLAVAALLGAIPWGCYKAARAFRRSLRALGLAALIGAGAALCYVLPYVLWTQAVIGGYWMATILALSFVVMVVVAGDRLLAGREPRLPDEHYAKEVLR